MQFLPILFVLLASGSFLSYTLSSYAIGNGTANIYHYVLNATSTGTEYNVSVFLNWSYSNLYEYVNKYDYSTFHKNFQVPDLYYIFYHSNPSTLAYILLFNNVTLTTYNLGGNQIPAIKFYNGDNYLTVSAQYGVMLQGFAKNYAGPSAGTLNVSISLNSYKNLPSFVSNANMYTLNVSFMPNPSALSYTLYLVSPEAKISGSNMYVSKEISIAYLSILSKGFTTIIIPSAYSIVRPIGEVIINQTNYYYFYLNGTLTYYGTYFTPKYYNSTTPFTIDTIGKYIVIFFPTGGNITVFLNNGNNPLYGVKVTGETGNKNTPLSLYLIIIGVVIVLVVAIIVLRFRKVF
ncbi:hypothetical protein [Sulfolobus acidocaldarius]|uniref:Conserved membrane protein n=4 Tax=Sulfolobus acidocaldarius TaxID=2285 RepID=Q4J9B9_SULAC|nr:hypothetical protein [Sulfolobus acidocaldarius]AAY80611.1 conserved membrane protein [Sulfolobus acidocaldarius DSM 639]AGE71202.1 hypothetical protein SacN8_06185 [Sulfolobus acidocaldarius N8]AGE73472.1 hypothetical protein SacRon12I_06180 [Sulfolobus acidocaldarius Ron12/I]ALU28534.1 hypothetical protein ATY89_00165 [Sulfolobus acidocaldarius]ALU31245.1 hypothetical protein ATZ20_03210 [Sulfolobus acidocaldarius]